MSFLRTVSTRRLLALLAGLVVAIAGGTAIAVAASSGGPVPPPKPLARAIRAALTAPTVNGISARVTFTNHLIDSSDIQGADPLLKGASGRVWLAKNRLRLELQSENGDAQVVVNNGRFWAYDPSRKTVYQGSLPAGHAKDAAAKKRARGRAKREKVPSVANIQAQLNKAARHLSISRANPTDVGGHAAYSVRVSPKRNGGLLGGAQLAWDAARGVPLSIGVYARGDSSPVLELRVTRISYRPVKASVFSISPPAGSKVVNVSSSMGAGKDHPSGRKRHEKAVSGAGAVAKRLSFKLDSPSVLAGRTRQEVRLLGSGRESAALVTYGNGLNGIAVLEQKVKSGKAATGSAQSASDGGDRRGLSLPTVSVNGTTAQRLTTPLGTLIRFTRGGVTYTVVGSVPGSTADAAARGL